MTRRDLLAAGVLLASAVTATGCAPADRWRPIRTSSSPEAAAGPVVVGSAAFTESVVLATLYTQALVAHGVDASTYLGIGPRETYYQAISGGDISVVPEYIGNLLAFLDPDSTAKTAAEVEAALPAVVGPDLALLNVSPAEDADVYVVTQATARRYAIRSLADLNKLPQPVPVGGPPENPGRPFGPAGLKAVYSVRVAFTGSVDLDARAAELTSGKTHVAAFSTTDAIIADKRFVQLHDPRSLILPQFQVPLVRRDLTTRIEVVQTLNAVSAALTTGDLARLNASVTVHKKTPDDVARQWLRSKQLATD